MNADIALKTCLEAWRLEYSKTGAGESGKSGHLSSGMLYRMACAGGLKDASGEDAFHLSTCPVCMGKWAKLRRAISDVEELDSPEPEMERAPVLSWGMLEAAATDKPVEALRIKSSCGNFVLGVLPEVGNPESGMITLELESAAPAEMEGRTAAVRDHDLRLILRGVIRNGRVARRIENLSKLNLARWSVVVE